MRSTHEQMLANSQAMPFRLKLPGQPRIRLSQIRSAAWVSHKLLTRTEPYAFHCNWVRPTMETLTDWQVKNGPISNWLKYLKQQVLHLIITWVNCPPKLRQVRPVTNTLIILGARWLQIKSPAEVGNQMKIRPHQTMDHLRATLDSSLVVRSSFYKLT